MSTPPALPSTDRGDRVRARLLLVVTTTAMAVGVWLSWKLWLPDRSYPLVPVWDGLPAVSAGVGQAWLVALLALLVTAPLLSRPGLALGLYLVGIVALGMWDQSRWQPWAYQYTAMLACLWAVPWGDPTKPERRRSALNACRVLLAGMYLWSGLQKFNVSFASEVFPWLIEPVVPEEARAFARHGALLPPVIEAALGVGLLVPAFRPLAVLGVLGMHAGVLYVLGPWGHDWNSVVWPWNGAMMAFVLILFVRTPAVTLPALLWPGRSLVHWGALVLFGVMPAFNFVGWWDSYLSAALYSGNTVKAHVVLSPAAYESLPPEVQPFALAYFDGTYVLDFGAWSMAELNVPVYPAERVFHGLFRELRARAPDGTADLVVRPPPHWLTGEREPGVR